mgnify:CR=1 FL=1
MIDNKVIKKAAKQYMERKIKRINKVFSGTDTIKISTPGKDGRLYSAWVNEDAAFTDGAKWAIRMLGKEAGK